MPKLSAKNNALAFILGALVACAPSVGVSQEEKKPNAKATGAIRFPENGEKKEPNAKATGAIQFSENEKEATETTPKTTGGVQLGRAPIAVPETVTDSARPQSTGQIRFEDAGAPVNQGVVTLSGNPSATPIDADRTVVVIFKEIPGEKTLEKIKAILERELYVITDDPAAENYLETKPWK